MPKAEKVKVNVKEKVEDNVCDLSLSELTDVPTREIALYKRVTVLDLSSNRLLTLGKNFHILTRLVKLDLSKNQIKYLPEEFGLLRNLRHLDLYNNKLEHLPLGFGSLKNLRYLDLKGNPLVPVLAKIVGLCLTTKECQESARNTVKFMAQMQIEAEKKRAQLLLEEAALKEETDIMEALAAQANEKTKKSNSKKSKAKVKKSNALAAENRTTMKNANKTNNNTMNTNTNNNNKLSNKMKSKSNGGNGGMTKKKNGLIGSTVFTSIFTFFLLLGINIMLIYMIMFKNPEIAEKLVEIIPHQYRDWILTKTEIFRIRVTDWIAEFRTPPEEQ